MHQDVPRLSHPGTGSAGSADVVSGSAARSRETAVLFDQLADADEAGRTQILEQVVLLNAGLALAVARRYRRRGIEGEDLDQTAYLALVLAARSFDATRGHDFVSFAVPSIVGGVKRHFRDLGWTIRVPRRVQEIQLLIDRYDLPEADATRYGPHTVARLADQLQVSVHDVEAALRARGCFSPASLDDPTTGHQARLGPVTRQQDEQDAVELRAMLRPLLGDLAPRDRKLLRLRFGEDRTQRSIAAELHLTQAQVSRLLTRIVTELRIRLESASQAPDHVT